MRVAAQVSQAKEKSWIGKVDKQLQPISTKQQLQRRQQRIGLVLTL